MAGTFYHIGTECRHHREEQGEMEVVRAPHLPCMWPAKPSSVSQLVPFYQRAF